MSRLFPYLLLLSIAILGSGCPITLTCVDIGCESGESCNGDTGLCEKIIRDCRTEPICRSTEVCDEETGDCRPERLRCTQSFTCPEGQSCNASSGFCEPALRCETNSDCGIAEQCDPTSQECEPRTCDSDADCPVAFVCDDQDECASGCRPNADGCPPRQFCRILAAETVGVCVPNCLADQDCPFGQSCDLTAAPESVCVAEGPCAVDADCRLDEICSDGTCVQPPCASDSDCLESQVCETATRICRPAECAEDNFGAGTVPNHSRQTAFTLDIGTYTQLVLCPGLSDWFALDVRSTDIIRARLGQQTPEPDLDLFVYDEDGSLLVRNQERGAVSSVKFAAGRTQVVFLEVRSTSFTGATYDLVLSSEVCANDTFEENDTLTEATVVPSSIGVPTELPLRACGFDEDWFRIRQNDASNGLRVERVASTADLFVEVLTPDGERYLVSSGTPFRALRAGAVGSTYVRAFGALGQTGDYRLAFEILEEWTCAGSGEHASAENAVFAPPDASLLEAFCPIDGAWEVDWVALEVPAAGLLEVQVRPVGDAPQLEVVLMTGDGVDNDLVRAAVMVNGIAHLQATVDPAALWFLRVSSAANVGRVLSEPRYEVEYVIR